MALFAVQSIAANTNTDVSPAHFAQPADHTSYGVIDQCPSIYLYRSMGACAPSWDEWMSSTWVHVIVLATIHGEFRFIAKVS